MLYLVEDGFTVVNLSNAAAGQKLNKMGAEDLPTALIMLISSLGSASGLFLGNK